MKTEKEIIDEAVEAIIEEIGGAFTSQKKEMRHIIAVAIRRVQALEQADNKLVGGVKAGELWGHFGRM
jgi:hypothetical protein